MTTLTTVANPAQRYLDHLTACVELAAARPALREIITLADQAPMLTGSSCDAGRSRWPGARHSGQRCPEVPDRPLVERGPRLGSRRPVGPVPRRPGWLPVEPPSSW